jgi:hypothetical protein
MQWIAIILLIIIVIIIFFSKNANVEGLASNPFDLSQIQSMMDKSNETIANANAANEQNSIAIAKTSKASADALASAQTRQYAVPNVQALDTSEYTINTQTSFINFINKMYVDLQIKIPTTATISSPASLTTSSTSLTTSSTSLTTSSTSPSISNNKVKNHAASIITISNMYPAFQSLINKDFNSLSNIYSNMIQTQNDVNHLMGLYFSSNAIHQYMNTVIENADLTAPGNEAKYNSQIGIYEQFCIHILYFYEKNLNLNGNSSTSYVRDTEGIFDQ